MSGDGAPNTPLSGMVLRSLKQFDAKRLLQQAAIGLMTDLMSDDDLRLVMRTFNSMDINGTTFTIVDCLFVLKVMV